MAKKPESGMTRLKKVPLWQWGLIAIFAGLMSGMLTAVQGPTGNSPEAQAQALGRLFAVGLFLLAGIVMIIVHFVRGRR